MAYIDIHNASVDTVFQNKCQVATWFAAQDIVSESPQTPEHTARLDWANKALTDRLNITPKQLATQVLRNTTIAADPGGASDGDIQFQVNSVLPQLILIG